MQFPEIKIFYSRLLDPFFIGHNKTYSRGGWDKWEAPSKEEVLAKTKELRNEWQKYEEKILSALYEITELEFKRNLIEVNIVSGSPRDMSRPLIISAHNPTKDFINTLTHELIHELFTDNISEKIYPSIFKNLFPNEKKSTQNHVIVHALLKYIYLDVLKEPERFKRNTAKSQNNPASGYSRAWEIVEEIGYLELIEKFKKKHPITI